MIKSQKNDYSDYIENRIDIGLFFFFVACAGVSIIVWVFNWICWLNQCCCCDFLHNPVNKRIVWWMSFTFLLGMLAFCISAFVSVNRFGFALEGALCSLDRIYYDVKNGQLKESTPKWTGINELKIILEDIKIFEEKLGGNNPSTLEEAYTPIYNALIGYFTNQDDVFIKLKGFLERNFFKKGKTIKICMKILSMIYFCLFLITITFTGVSMMFYACLKRQGYLMTFMHIFWNIIRFFMFSFFIFGAFYGIFSLALKDYIAVIYNLFETDQSPEDIPEIVKKCSKNKNFNFESEIDEKENFFWIEFLTNFLKLKDILSSKDENNLIEPLKSLKEKFISLCTSNNLICEDLAEIAGQEGGLFGSFNCTFVKNDLNITYLTLYEAAKESEKLSAFSLSASFFGAVAVYFYLLVMHHYNNELFFDSGKSIFTGFDGFGGGYKKQNRNQDPAYKKRKLRAEIELTSKNENDEEQ